MTTLLEKCQGWLMAQNLMTLAEVAELLNVSASQAYSLVRTGELRALKIGGRGQWRIQPEEIDKYLTRCYQRAEANCADLLNRADFKIEIHAP